MKRCILIVLLAVMHCANTLDSGPRLVSLGGSGCTETQPCRKCQGDCDSDKDCHGGLKCFQREGNQQVPGCDVGGSDDVKGHDYCYQKVEVAKYIAPNQLSHPAMSLSP